MPTEGINELSERELDILKLVATGASNKEIAQKLYISSNTVKVHLRNIFTKIGVTSRTEAAMYAVHTGLVTSPSSAIPNEGLTETVSANAGQAAGQSSIAAEATLPTRTPLTRWAPYLLVVGLLGLIFLGWRLSPSLGIFTSPTPTLLPPRDTPTPIPHWNYLAALPSPRSDAALVAYANQVYVVGGLDSHGVVTSFERFNPQDDSWTSLAPKPIPVYNASAAVISGLIYVPGGRISADRLTPTDVLEIYDTNTNQWYMGPSLPVPLSAYCSVTYEGNLYIFGGWDGQTYRNQVYAYDPATDTWNVRTAMPTARGFCGAAEAAGKIYVIGGTDGSRALDVNEIYSPALDHDGSTPWETGFPLPQSHISIQAATIADTVYVFGSDTQDTNREGLIYFPQSDVWQSLEASPKPLGKDFGMAAIGTNLFFVGGKIDSTFSDQNLSYQAIITFSIPIIIR